MKIVGNKIRIRNGSPKLRNTSQPIDGSVIINHINSSIYSKLINKTPSTDKSIYSYRNPWLSNGVGIFTRNPSCWLNGVKNISCISPAQMSGALWYQRGGTLISPRHFALGKHFVFAILSGGTDIKFVDDNNNVVTRKLKAYESLSETDIAIGVLDSDVPSSIKFAKVLPNNHSTYIASQTKYIIMIDQEQKALVATNGFFPSYPNDFTFYSSISSDPIAAQFWEAGVAGDSGQPWFTLIDNELVIISTWWGPETGPSYSAKYDAINNLMNKLGGGYNLTPVDLEGVYNKYK